MQERDSWASVDNPLHHKPAKPEQLREMLQSSFEKQP
jgi:hypothetical protein